MISKKVLYSIRLQSNWVIVTNQSTGLCEHPLYHLTRRTLITQQLEKHAEFKQIEGKSMKFKKIIILKVNLHYDLLFMH